MGGSPQQFYWHARQLADQGMVAISAEYRVNRRHKTPPFVCVEDAKSAVRYIRQHAEELGVDPNRVAAGGGSAGGHLAVCTAVIRGFDAEDGPNRASAVPNLVVAFNPVLDTGPLGYGQQRDGTAGYCQAGRWPLHHHAQKAGPNSVLDRRQKAP